MALKNELNEIIPEVGDRVIYRFRYEELAGRSISKDGRKHATAIIKRILQPEAPRPSLDLDVIINGEVVLSPRGVTFGNEVGNWRWPEAGEVESAPQAGQNTSARTIK